MNNLLASTLRFHSRCVCWFLLLASGWAQAQFTLDREPTGPSSRKTSLVITEIMYNPRQVPGQSTNNTLEFIELFNSRPWDEYIGGFSIAGTVRYTFPADTVLGAGAYLVVARVPGLVVTNYGITNVLGPWDGAATNRLSTENGTVQLRNRQGAVLLQVEYRDAPPWPEAADGTGHSLALVRPSFGENDYRAWAESDRVGGSPGSPEPVTHDPLASVLINEWQNHSDPSDWIELYNHSNQAVDLSGANLSDNPQGTNAFRIPNGTTIPARGFVSWDQTQLGFELFAGGETIYFWNSNKVRIIDCIDFRGQSNNVSSGRWPDGGPNQYGLSRTTRGSRNATPIRYGVVINEIMYNPISGNNDDEYVEIYNRGNQPVNLSGWEFVSGINYAFATNSLTQNMQPGAYWLLAKNPARLAATFTNLNTNYIFGPYSGTLANGGERLVLAAADYDIVSATNEKLNVPVSDLTYGDGGRWGNWSDGQGSSLELIDPEADVHHPSNWADSDDPGESLWTAIEWTGPLGESLGTQVNDSVILMLEGVGECLVDEVEVRVDNGANLVANGGFESGLAGWTLQGSHDLSTLENQGFAGARSLHIRAGSRGDNQSNRILSSPLAQPIPPTAGSVSIRAKAKWVRGHPELLVRLHGSATEAYGRMALPRKLGTPGASNSRRVPNAGPAISEVKHAPLLPAADQAVVVTARAADPQGLATLILRYRVDPNPNYIDVPMTDTGADGDEIADDGIFSGAIPQQPLGNMVAFYVEARDNQGAVATFPRDVFPPAGLDRCWPNDALVRECIVRWGEVQMPGDFATYHLWVSAVNSNRWHVRDTMGNTPMDGTFVYNNSRVIYNALPLYSGSPFHRTNSTTGPAGPYRVDYALSFPEDEPLLGANDFVLANPGNPNLYAISDLSAIAEQAVYKILDDLGMPNNHRRFFHLFINGNQRSTAYERPGNFIFEDAQQPNGDVVGEWFPSDAGGQLFKIEDWFEFATNGFDFPAYREADLTRRTAMLDGQPTLLPAPYRFMFRKRSVNVGNSANDFSPIFALVDAVSPADNPDSPVVDPAAFGAVADWESWMRLFAVERAVGNFDSYGWAQGKNVYLYQGSAGGFAFLPWDIDYSLGLGRPANEPLFASDDPRVRAMFNTPEIVRAYWRAFTDLVDGPFSNAALDPFLDARAATLKSNNVNIDLDAVAAIKTYIGNRRAFLRSQLDTVAAPFLVLGPTIFETTNNLLVITGTAPVVVKQVLVNGNPYPLTWTTATNFVVRLILGPGSNQIQFQGLDRFGTAISNATQSLSVTYTGPVVDPVGALIISEILFAAPTPGAQFIEIVNHSPVNFDLSGWRLDGAGLVFPVGSIVTNRQTIVVARNKAAFQAAFGKIPVFAVFGVNLPSTQGQVLTLVRPGAAGDQIIDAVRYDVVPPWPKAMAGESLQLIDLAQDHTRVSNWAVDTNLLATPGGPSSVAAELVPYDPIWLNELQIESFTGLVDNFGDADPALELYNAGPTPVSLDGYFLADNFTNLVLWPFPPGTTLNPGEFRLVWTDGEPDETDDNILHTSFRLEDRGELALARWIDSQPQITDYFSWRRLTANLSYGSFPDGQSVFRSTLYEPTPAGTNVERALPVFINEFMARNTSYLPDPVDGAYDDWFELYNGSERTVDLGGYFLTDAAENPTRFQIPANRQYTLAPGGFILVWADDQAFQNSRTNSDLHTSFRLSSSSGMIALYAPDGQTLVDYVSYGLQTTNTSEGRYSDGASARYSMPRPTPKKRNAMTGYNTPPQFPAFTNAVVSPGQIYTLPLRATDPDGASNILSMVSAPEGSIIYQTGYYRWIVPTNQPPGDYAITLQVTDRGTPPRSDVTTFIITVRGPLDPVSPATGPTLHSTTLAGGQAAFTIDTVPGHIYRVFFKNDLTAPAWTQLGPDFMAANATASFTDPGAAPQRFYQVQQVD